MPAFLHVDEMPTVPGLRTPGEFYTILQFPAPLAGMRYPNENTPWQSIYQAGFRHVVSLTGAEPAFDPAPLSVLYAAKLDDLYGGIQPGDPAREERQVRAVVAAALEKLKQGEGVVVHCAGGTGRTGTVIGCLLREMGFSADEVIGYLEDLNRKRGKSGWPESTWQAEMVHRYRADIP